MTTASTGPDMYVVVFRADWCGPCRILEPRLRAALSNLNDRKIEYVEIDISNQPLSEIGAHKAFDRNIVAQYNQWLGITGFAVMIDADTKRTLGCVNKTYDAEAMKMHIRNLKTHAVTNHTSFDTTCPPANHR
ncbi:MAG: thioredoxin domain-containing protein [Alphaproteobacteria bacterium]